MERKIQERITQAQLEFYNNFVEARNKKKGGVKSHKHPWLTESEWEELAQNLNAMPGPTRTVEKWRINFVRWKNQVRCRARKAEARTTTTSLNAEDASSMNYTDYSTNDLTTQNACIDPLRSRTDNNTNGAHNFNDNNRQQQQCSMQNNVKLEYTDMDMQTTLQRQRQQRQLIDNNMNPTISMSDVFSTDTGEEFIPKCILEDRSSAVAYTNNETAHTTSGNTIESNNINNREHFLLQQNNELLLMIKQMDERQLEQQKQTTIALHNLNKSINLLTNVMKKILDN